jgi:hypothetical protein
LFKKMDVLLRLHNATSCPVELFWVPDCNNDEHKILYTTLASGQVHTQQTYAGHRWSFLLTREGGAADLPLSHFDAPDVSCTLEIQDDGFEVSHGLVPMHVLHGCTLRATILGLIPVCSFGGAVGEAAVDSVVDCITSIVSNMPEANAVLRDEPGLVRGYETK